MPEHTENTQKTAGLLPDPFAHLRRSQSYAEHTCRQVFRLGVNAIPPPSRFPSGCIARGERLSLTAA